MKLQFQSCCGIKTKSCIAMIVLLVASTSFAGEHDCGPLRNFNDYGPFDYQDPENRAPTGADPMGRVKRVENVHFQNEMKLINLKKYSIARLAGEYTYTLRVFPNHSEALHAMSRLEKIAGGSLPQQAITPFTPKISAYCFFDRAIRFRPEDPHVRYMHAIHLHDRKQYAEAREAYALAEKLGMDNPNFFYNYGPRIQIRSAILINRKVGQNA